MPLTLVPKRDPEPAEAVRTRIKRMARPDGLLQCPRCGGRSVCKIENGIIISQGKRLPGTVIAKDVCADCWRSGIHVDMKTGTEKPTKIK